MVGTYYYQEIDFINQKWTTKEVENFIFLVEGFIERLSSGIEEGKVYPNTPIYSVVISKQTTVFLRKFPEDSTITLLLFWNNQKDSKNLKKLLQKHTLLRLAFGVLSTPYNRRV